MSRAPTTNAPVLEESTARATVMPTAWVALALVLMFAVIGLWQEHQRRAPSSSLAAFTPTPTVNVASSGLGSTGVVVATTEHMLSAQAPPPAASSDTLSGAIAEALEFEEVLAVIPKLLGSEVQLAVSEHLVPGAGGDVREAITAWRSPCGQAEGRLCPTAEAVLSLHSTAFSPTVATVETWSVVVTPGGASSPASAQWWLDRISLAFTPHGWRVSQFIRAPGPTPASLPGAAPSLARDPSSWEPVVSGVAP